MKKTITPAIFFLPLLAALFSLRMQAQALTASDIKDQMIKDWERAKAYTIDYLNTMPANKYSFKPVDSVRSFGQHMLHLAQFNCGIVSAATDDPVPAWVTSDPQHRMVSQNKDSVFYYVTASYDFCINAIKQSDTNKWGEKKKIFGEFEETRFALMNKAFEHQTHHRGQTTVYIRLQGIIPPDERLF